LNEDGKELSLQGIKTKYSFAIPDIVPQWLLSIANSAVVAMCNLFEEFKSGRCINFIPIFCESVIVFVRDKGIFRFSFG